MAYKKLACFVIVWQLLAEISLTISISTQSIAFLNGTVYTVDKATQWERTPQQAIVIEDGRIVFVGSDAEAEGYIEVGTTRVINLHESVVLPGFHDVHTHPLEARSPIAGACELPALTRPDSIEFDDELSDCPNRRFGTEWILGYGHSITPMMEYVRENRSNSPKALLDEYIPDRPAAMLEETSHSAWVNSRALQLAGINSSTPERPGGVIMREYGSNEPNGILFENEAISIFQLAFDPTNNNAILQHNLNGLVDALGELSKYGITSVCDARVFWKSRHDLAWEQACGSSELTVRAVLGLWAYPELDDDYQIQQLKSLHSTQSNHTECSMSKSQIKLYMDGLVQSTTAAMQNPYLLNLSLPEISRENVGMNYFDRLRLEKYLRQLQDFGDGTGFDFHIHAIGDRGIREALDAINNTQDSRTTRTPRHRITHVEVLDRRDVPRFSELGVIADFQVAGNFTLPSEYADLAEFIGLDKASFSIPVRSVVETGAMATFSSDWDVSTLNPFIGLQHATQRGAQSVSLKTAVEMYTANAAYAMRQENEVGVLKEGMQADMVVIDRDIFNIANNSIGETLVLMTVFKGDVIYSRPGSVVQDITTTFKPTSVGSLVTLHKWIYIVVIAVLYLLLVQ